MTLILTHKDEAKKLQDMFDTDAESIGDTTTQSIGNSIVKERIQTNRPNDELGTRDYSGKGTPLLESSRSLKNVNNAAAIVDQKGAEDNASSIYPEAYSEDQAYEEEDRGDSIEHTHHGIPFLKPGESQEWKRYLETSATSVSQLDVEVGSQPESEDVKIPERTVSMSHFRNTRPDVLSRQQKPQQFGSKAIPFPVFELQH